MASINLWLIFGISFTLLFTSPAWGLENNTEYAFLGDEIFIVLETIGDNEMSVIDGGFLINDEWNYFDIENIKITRITADGEEGKIFGQTENDHNFFIKWIIDGNTAKIIGKMWTDDDKIRTIESVDVEPLFINDES